MEKLTIWMTTMAAIIDRTKAIKQKRNERDNWNYAHPSKDLLVHR